MATPQQQEALHREGRLILALQAYKQGQTNPLTPPRCYIMCPKQQPGNPCYGPYINSSATTEDRHEQVG